MSQSQYQSLEPKNHRRRNKVYTIPIVAIPIKLIIFRNPCNPRVYDEKIHNYMTNKNKQEMALYNKNTINATLYNIHAVFIFVFPGQDKCYLSRNLPDKMALLVSTRLVTARDINRWISNTMTCYFTSMSHVLSISANVSSEIEVNLLPGSVELMMHKLFYDLKQPIIAKAHRVKLPKNSIKIDTKFTRFKSLEHTNKLIKSTPKITVKSNTASIAANRSSIPLCKWFKTYFVEGRRMTISYKTSTCKYNSFSVEILKNLVVFLYSSDMVFNKIKSTMLSLCQRNWYVRNVAQGYLLTILLTKCNIAPLNVIRIPYFVIIMSETYHIISVEINFKVGNGMAMAFNTRVFEKCSFDFAQWNDEHKHILEDTISFSFCIYKPRDERAMPTDVDTIECKINPSYYGSNTTLKTDPTDERDYGTDMKNIFYSESELFGIKSRGGSEIQVNGSVRKLHIGEVASEKCVYSLRRICGNMNFRPRTTQVPSDIHDTIVKLTKACFLKLFDKSQTIKAYFGIPHMNCDRLINETIFDNIVI